MLPSLSSFVTESKSLFSWLSHTYQSFLYYSFLTLPPLCNLFREQPFLIMNQMFYANYSIIILPLLAGQNVGQAKPVWDFSRGHQHLQCCLTCCKGRVHQFIIVNFMFCVCHNMFLQIFIIISPVITKNTNKWLF